MSDEGNKTEEPTPKKIKDARKKGNVGFSKDLSMFGSISTMVILLYCLRHVFGNRLHEHWEMVFALINSGAPIDLIAVVTVGIKAVGTVVLFVGPFVGAAAMVTLVITLMQHGGMLITDKLFKFDLKKFDVVANLQNIFSKKNFTKFALNCIKVTVMVYVGYLVYKRNFNDILLLREIPLDSAINFMVNVILDVVMVLLAMFFLFGIVDLILEKKSVHSQLMMTMEEVKREYKESEGDQEVKHQRKELHRELMEEEPNHGANSSFVIANPTHIAIVVTYKPLKWKIPIVLAKEKGEKAQQVFNYAKKRKIPIFRDKWLARQLYEIAEIKEFIPRTLLIPVAELVSKNIQLLPQIALDLAEAQKPVDKNAVKMPGSVPTVAKDSLFHETLRN